ncbi:NAD+ synthase [Candidatus Persebacteraceae bacterium Df01]|jgi:NAD+ synthase (glutamine-hydrolysing)|uniref:Glutamine-dependent NAD(+) synthetase n=1 Tax=Candidatus Doriopsillibacter californiensis TaxID=2970740 RepID=A0ABT7QNB8_9GAMM|nr:NAD+ synthase [Candidatus Persebacteraceae bacterium Df01]
MQTPTVLMVQQDFAVGDLTGNQKTLLASAHRAHQAGAAVLLSPELSLTGYCPEDMLHDSSFLADTKRALQELIAVAPPISIIVGLPWQENGKLFNAAALIQNGRLTGVYKKRNLPNYSVFDERRYFDSDSASKPLVFSVDECTFAIQICADIWASSMAEQAAQVRAAGVNNTLVLNGSPFYLGKLAVRVQEAKNFAAAANCGVFYCNCVGGQDELIFDGASFAINAGGKMLAQFPIMKAHEGSTGDFFPVQSDEEMLYEAIVMGVRDYAAKTGFNGVLLGLSGGIDSALVAAVAADALGENNVLSVMMPSPFTSSASKEDATTIALNIGSELLNIPLEPLMESIDAALRPHLYARDNDVTMENVQARLRGQLLMALSNNRNLLLLTTGNKSELACGYATLYGDMCGGFAPLKDLNKTWVWRLARWRNQQKETIPQRVINRAPSAELRDNQTDQDSLPPYEKIDAAIAARMEKNATSADIARDFGDDFSAQFFRLLQNSEYKRRQAAPGPKLTPCAFGRDWRMPIANRYRHD